MKILFVLPRQHPNQAGWYKALSKNGDKVKYMVAYSLPINERQDLPEPLICKEAPSPLWYRSALKLWTAATKQKPQTPYLLWPDRDQLEAQILEFDPDIVIVREALTPLALTTQSIARKRGIQSVHYSQAPITKTDGFVFKTFRKLQIVPKFKMTPTLDASNAKNWASNSYYVPLFAPTAKEVVSSGISDPVHLLFVGKYNSRRKNHVLLLEALASLSDTVSFHLTMVGSTVYPNEEYHQEILQRIEELNLSNKVTLLYDVSPLEMNNLYLQHDLFVLPSVDEPFAISPLEAMAHGLPAIVTDSNGCQFHITDDVNGFVVKSNDLRELKSALINATNKEKLPELKKNALNYTMHQNNEKIFIKYFEKMITDIK